MKLNTARKNAELFHKIMEEAHRECADMNDKVNYAHAQPRDWKIALQNTANLKDTSDVMAFEEQARVEAVNAEQRCYAYERSKDFNEHESNIETQLNQRLKES